MAARPYVFPLDYTIQAWVQGGRRPELEAAMRALTRLGSGWVLAPLGILAWLALRRVRHPLARRLPATIVGAFVVETLAKWLVSRPRPRGGGYGFPSGHTFGAAVFFGAAVCVLWTSRVGRAWRWTGTIVAALLVVGIGYSRVYLRAHWGSDVAGGLLGGLAYVLLALVPGLGEASPETTGTRRDAA